MGFVRWFPSTIANNPENAEAEGASVAGWIGICRAIGQEEDGYDTCTSVPPTRTSRHIEMT
jgi:hypothetical protein